MQQPLIIDQRAMAEQAMARLLTLIAETNEFIDKQRPDLNRKQRRAFETKLVPIRAKLKSMQAKQKLLQEEIDALVAADA